MASGATVMLSYWALSLSYRMACIISQGEAVSSCFHLTKPKVSIQLYPQNANGQNFSDFLT
jgi:hypothetical protein